MRPVFKFFWGLALQIHSLMVNFMWTWKELVFSLLFYDSLMEVYFPLWDCKQHEDTAIPCCSGITKNALSLLLQIQPFTSPPSSVDHIFTSGASRWVQLPQWEFGGWRERDWGIFHPTSLPAGLGQQQLASSWRSPFLPAGSCLQLQLLQCSSH